MIERRGRNFDSSLFRRLSMRRQNFADQLALALYYELLIFPRESPCFLDQLGNRWFFQEKFVVPCNLRQHLQIGVILSCKKTLGALGGRCTPSETVIKFGVTRVPPNQVFGMRLK